MKKIIKYTLVFTIILGIVYYVWPENKLEQNQRIDKIVVNKHDREMIVYNRNQEIARYTVSLGSIKWPSEKWGPILSHNDGPKLKSGDAKTPEGIYKLSPNFGKYQPALRINFEDIHLRSGGAILIHGPSPTNKWAGKFLRWIDWTDGCIALTETEIKEIYNAVIKNCPIEINH